MGSVESKIAEVTVYASGARIRRVATVAGPLPTSVRFVGLPLSVIDDTVSVEVEGHATVIAVRTGSEVPETADAAEDSPELRAAGRRVTLAETEVERISLALARLAETSIIAPDPSEAPPAAWHQVIAARRMLVAVRAERELALREGAAAARREVEEARRELEITADRDRRTGTARAAKLHELRKYVELELASQSAGDVTIYVEYQVAAARWAPSYVARLDGDQARFELRAVVAQDSGEDWSEVALRLSTAEPERFTQLPELVPQKIGRRQAETARRGFRAPPTGTDELYADYDRGFPKRARSKPFAATAVLDDSTFEGRVPEAGAQAEGGLRFEQQNWDEDSSEARAFEPVGTPPPQMMQMIAKKSRAGGPPPGAPIATRSALTRAGTIQPAPAPQAPTPRLDYGSLRMASAGSPERGRLVPAPRSPQDAEITSRVARASAAMAELVLPRGCATEWLHTYDYAFAAEGKVDVRADGAWHSIAVTARASKAKLHHVAVPREQPDVFRVATIGNPLEGPLLPGPIDVYDRGQFLVTSEVDYTPPGAAVEIGLGVDASVKIARNAEFHEEATGMLRGGLKLVHAITIAIENLSARAIDIEVRERIPVTREGDDEIEVTLGKIDPAWERWTPDATAPRDERLRGAYRWSTSVPAAAKQLLRAGYEVKIAGKLELVGGNRRES
ncbi:MAG: hypothetical protein JWO36_4267 [Myxococcales bacterium]|nr:hypothetical protein [Myxococcales bacterium]